MARQFLKSSVSRASWDFTKMKPLNCATGIFRRRTILESWGDARAYDGTVSFIQPLISPLYDGKSACEIFAALQGHADKTPYDLVREFWKSEARAKRISRRSGRRRLHDGVIAGQRFRRNRRELGLESGVTLKINGDAIDCRVLPSDSKPKRLKSYSDQTPQLTTVDLRTMAGCRKRRSPSRSSPGTTRRN